jgi:hypothetical protein
MECAAWVSVVPREGSASCPSPGGFVGDSGHPSALHPLRTPTASPGHTYGMGKMYGSGVYKGKKAMLVLTTGGPEAAYAESESAS